MFCLFYEHGTSLGPTGNIKVKRIFSIELAWGYLSYEILQSVLNS